MTNLITIHFDNFASFSKPTLLLKHENDTSSIQAKDTDNFGVTFQLQSPDNQPLIFKFYDAETDKYENDLLWRTIPLTHLEKLNEFWCRGWNAFVYLHQPQIPQPLTAEDFVAQQSFVDKTFVSDTGGKFGLGSSFTQEGDVLFGLFHPHAGRVYVIGDLNDWQHPDQNNADPAKFLEMDLYQGYFETPNIWLLKLSQAQVGQGYKFYVDYDSIAGDGVFASREMVDPYARFLGESYERNDSLIVNPNTYNWQDSNYQTPAIHDLIIYELHVHGFTHKHKDVPEAHQGKYAGIIDRIKAGYFDKLGITCLYLMPISEVSTPQAEDALGYNSSLFLAIERDFGTPDELRELVDVAHQHGLAVIIDQVFNHSANSWNPLWKFILDHPDETHQDAEGGIYFSGASPWGNRMATERTETQNMLIDACKLMIKEYHIDGFRFDATHTNYIDHSLMHRLADEVQAMKPDVILIAENLPNQNDMNREGYNGFGQWNDYFHDAIKSFLREAKFEGTDDTPENLGDIFYFSKGKFAAHTNNVVNYCESHDEHSVAHELSFVESLNTPQAKERKSRLGLFATMVALGQPMIYMGQELGTERERNLVYFDFPDHLNENGFYQWASRLICLRRRYEALKLHGFNPMADGQFHWLLGPWLDARKGQGQRVIGWRSTPNDKPEDQVVVLLNFENHPIKVDIQFGMSGKWVRLATIDEVNDIPPEGNNSIHNETTINLESDTFSGFTLPDSSAFIYTWEPNE